MWELLRLAVITRGRVRGAYWAWRRETAFGKHEPTGGEQRGAMLHYGDWVRRMRKLS